MSADRELLGLAAKAAGERGRVVQRHYRGALVDVFERVVGSFWMPHLDDGDALRLAVKLRLVVHVWDDESAVSAAKTLPDGDDPEDASEAWRSADSREFGGLDTAARYAIVSAAAEIGRAMT